MIKPLISVGVTLVRTVGFRRAPVELRKVTVVSFGSKFAPAIVYITELPRNPKFGEIEVKVGDGTGVEMVTLLENFELTLIEGKPIAGAGYTVVSPTRLTANTW